MKTLIIPTILATLALTACRDSFDVDTLNNPPKLTVYCFPSQADTTYISVTNSIGVKRFTDEHRMHNLTDARVTYAVNGQPRTVQQTADGTFFVAGAHQPGDHVTVGVEHDDYPAVTAATTIPQPVAVELGSVREVTEYDASWYEMRTFYQLTATFTDPAETTDYYAVQVIVRNYREYYHGGYADELPEISTIDEPLLQHTSDIDEDFGFENNFYDRFYIFTDQEINGQTYTLHLNISAYSVVESQTPQCRVVLYRITPDYYRFVKSINDVENNELAKGGFAQLTPTHTNVSGGVGVVGGYWASASPWHVIGDYGDRE